MNWKNYRKKFTLVASSQGYTNDEIKIALKYARKLVQHNLPIIYSQNHFATLVGYSIEYLRRASSKENNSFYRHFTIPKKSSEKNREIDEPLPSLKEIQRWILDNILCEIPISPYSKAYRKGQSIKSNARFHIKQKYVVRLDIKDFFPSINFKQVFKIFKETGYSKEVCGLLTGLCSLDNCLPQGAPTSPALSNIFMYRFDNRISKYCVKNKIRYTRYADDMTFSGDFNYGSLISIANKILSDYELELHHEKTKVMTQAQQQRTTGLILNSKMNTPRVLRRKIRQELHYLKKFGLSGHLNYTQNTKANYLQHLLGLCNFVLNINPQDRDALEARSFIYKKIS
ncbi:retron St85 family RNA-directed DNA polymerase [Maridesulfovibrio sp.]|uniref:retron St85 family RNA-directed DNA polymerase n=1 Tax=Maridesulfovibrio sp. TaxID=2795000 RepID=UPI0029CA2761|nr:retron St85 family RNA-directed DNA polymerase [Maridesulfovibrio sp.]